MPVVFVAIQLIISGPTNALPSMNLLTSSAKVRLLQFTRQCNNSIKVRWENCSFFRFIRGVASIAIDRNGGASADRFAFDDDDVAAKNY